jgi:hypothetical protein
MAVETKIIKSELNCANNSWVELILNMDNRASIANAP